MKLSKFSLALGVALLGSLIMVSAQAPSSEAAVAEAPAVEAMSLAERLVAAVESMGPDVELSPVKIPEGWKAPLIFAADKVTLARLPVVNNTTNEKAAAIFSYWATPKHIVWKLTLIKIDNFTGAHLHRVSPPTNPIVQHLVPKFKPGNGDFISPIDIPKIRVFTGSFGLKELRETLGVTSIKQFLTEFVATNQIFINVHGPGTVPILRGFLNV